MEDRMWTIQKMKIKKKNMLTTATCPTCWVNIFWMSKALMVLQRQQTLAQRKVQLHPNVGPSSTCYLGMSDYYCLLWVGWRLPNSVQRRTFATCEYYHISSLFLFFASDIHRFLPILSRLTCAEHVFCTLFSCLSKDSSLYHVIFSHVTVFSVFFVQSKVELCDPQCEFW